MTIDLQLSDRRRLLLEALLKKEGVQTAPQPQIPRRPESGPANLSFGQQRLWFLHQLDPAGVLFNLPEAIRLSGPIDAAVFRHAFGELLRRHEALRTLFGTVDGEPVQIVTREPELPLCCADLSGLPAEARDREAGRLGHLLVTRPFDLTRSLPLRAALLRLAEGDHALVLVMHHIASDAWSMEILVRELRALYGAFASGRPSPFSELPIQYADFAAWQRDRLQGETLEALLRYWRERLAGAPTSLALPSDRPRPPIQSSRGGSLRIALDPDATAALREAALARGASMFMLLTAAFGVLLQRMTGTEDLLVGTPVAGRTRRELEGLIGFFVNMLPLRLDLSGDPLFPVLLERMRETILQAEAHQDLPFESLIKALDVPRDLSQTPLFQVVLAFQSLAARRDSAPVDSPAPFSVETRAAQYDLHLLLTELPQRISGELIYRADLFDDASAARLARSFETLLLGIAGRRAVPISELPLLTPEERRHLISAGNDAGARFPPAPLHRLFADSARRAPGAEALSWDGARWSYAELEGAANRLARRLRRLGVGPESRVGLCLERSPEMIAAILAVLQAGAAYVPLDPDLPRERLAFLLGDCGASVLLTWSGLEARLPEAPGITRLLLDTERRSIDEESSEPLRDVVVDPGQAAYVIYTSGSTGRPKGVVVTHANVARLLTSTQDRFAFGPADVWTLFHSYAFDFSVWEIWGALAWGGRLVIVPYWISRSPEAFLDLLESERVTVLNQTPSAFRQLAAVATEKTRRLALRFVVFGGEALDPSTLASWFDAYGDREPLLVNMYGITETTVHVTDRPMSRADLGLGSRIGLPIPDLQVHVLDRHFEPVPLLVPGEIHVGGAGLARGYLHRPELTAERFVADPFSPGPGARLYRSGDLARRRPDGELEYLGRIDHQVKIRGFRIELGEIQAALAAHPAVREAVVLARRGGDGARLVAWFVPRDSQAPRIAELRSHLEQRLPSYMVPAAFVELDRLPLTANGKLDREALPDPDPATAHSETEHVAPETPDEMALAQVWSEVLGVPRVGVLDSFFALGGDSIRSLQVLALAREKDLTFSVQDLFQHQTIRELAEVLRQRGRAEPNAAARRPFDLIAPADLERLPEGIEDAFPLIRLQAGMLFHTELSPKSGLYQNILSFSVRAGLDLPHFEAALARLVERHPVLRTGFHLSGFSEPLQLVHRTARIPVELHDLRGLTEAEQERAIEELLEAEKVRPFDWRQPPLLRIALHLRAEERFQLTLTKHHSILDGWSMASLLTELFNLYVQDSAALTAAEPAPPPAFRDFVALERQALASEEARAYWQSALSGVSWSRLPRRPDTPDGGAPLLQDNEVIRLPEAVVEGLRELARRLSVPLKSVMLASHLKVVSLLAGNADVVTGISSDGRPEAPGSDRALGIFVSMLPLRLRLRQGSWLDLIRQVFDAERELLGFRRFPFAEIQRLHGNSVLFETGFNFVHFHVYREVERGSGVQIDSRQGFELLEVPLTTNCAIDPLTGQLSLEISGHLDVLSREQIEAAAGYYQRALESIAAEPEADHASAVLLSAAERAWLLSAGRPSPEPLAPPDRSIPSLFSAQAARTPESRALVIGSESMTYEELERRANQLAHHLLSRGLGPEVRSALLLPRAPDAIVTILGVLKAGGAWLPLDPAQPTERLRFMMEDSGVSLLITDQIGADRLTAGPGFLPMVLLDSDAAALAARSAAPPERQPGAEDLAYIIYTSGSTGRPKGTMLPHRGLANLAASFARFADLRPGDRFLQFSSLTFDAAVAEILPALLTGAELHLPEPGRLPAGPDLLELLDERRITHATLPPSVVAGLPQRPLPDLRVLTMAGEACPAELVERWAPGRRLVNGYGPTEASVCTTLADVPVDGRKPPIGRPIPGVRALVVDTFGQPAPTGAPGELWIGGIGLARGYLGRPDLTAAAFVPDPWCDVWSLPGERLYRTGDLARRLPDGQLDFLGRIDHQVKIRGFRIELSEIEARLLQDPLVRAAAAVAREDRPGDRRIVAYLVLTEDGNAPAAELAGSHAAELRDSLRKTLPDFMLPAAFVQLPELPLTAHGKLDRSALPPPATLARTGESSHVPPRSPIEERLAALWAEVLELETVSVLDDFLALGGHSLLAVQLITRIREAFGVNLPLRALYEEATVARMAVAVVQAQAEQTDQQALEQMLAQLEQLSDEEAAERLAQPDETEGALR